MATFLRRVRPTGPPEELVADWISKGDFVFWTQIAFTRQVLLSEQQLLASHIGRSAADPVVG